MSERGMTKPKKPRKRKPREWWIVFFDNRGTEVFCSLSEAEHKHAPGLNPQIIRVREVPR